MDMEDEKAGGASAPRQVLRKYQQIFTERRVPPRPQRTFYKVKYTGCRDGEMVDALP